MTTRRRVSPRTVCVVGGGSLAHALVAVLGARKDVALRVLTRRPDDWSSLVRAYYRDLVIEGRVDRVSDQPAEVLREAQIVAIAVPFAALREVLTRIRSSIESDAWVGGFPGYGGFDWLARSILGAGTTLFGVQRIPYVCHKVVYGREVAITGIRPQLFVAALPATRVNQIAATIEELMHMRTVPVSNYLNVTLSTSNPIMHPARLHAMFRNFGPGRRFDHCPRFYGDWDHRSTAVYLRCDDEIHAICRAVPLDLGYVKGLIQHFEVATRPDITRKIRSLTSLQHRPAPMRQVADGAWVPDFQHPYFTEDIPYGLVIQRAVAEIAGVRTPTFDRIISWAQEMMGTCYLAGNRLAGRDACRLPLPQNLGIVTVADLVRRAVE